jgi:hypothetical protein
VRQLVRALAPIGLLASVATFALPDLAWAQAGCEGVCPGPGEPPPPPPVVPPPPPPPVSPPPPPPPPLDVPIDVSPDPAPIDFGPDFSPEVVGTSAEPQAAPAGGPVQTQAGAPGGADGGVGALVVTTGISPETTARIAAQTRESFEFCAALVAREYVVDCLSERLAEVARTIPETGDYAEMRQTIEAASERLGEIVERYPSRDLPTGVARSTGAAAVQTTRPLRPVATAAVETAVAEASDVIEETAAALLRTDDLGATAERAAAYEVVSETLETGAALLRST